MMMFKNVVDEVLRVCRASNDAALREVVKNLINIKYFDLCREFSLRNLRAKITLDFTTADDDGLWLPSNLYGIDMVRDEDEIEFYERDRSDIEDDEFGYRYFRYKGSDTPLIDGDDIIINNGASSFTSATVDAYVATGASVLNKYIRINNEPGFYKITNTATPYTIAPNYYGPFQDEEIFRIRPEEDERMCIINSSETLLKDRSIDLYYWRAPAALYRDSDFILLPHAMPLQLLVLRELPEAKALRPVSQSEIDQEKDKMKAMNPTFVRLGNPRDKHNNIFDLSPERNFFKQRGG